MTRAGEANLWEELKSRIVDQKMKIMSSFSNCSKPDDGGNTKEYTLKIFVCLYNGNQRGPNLLLDPIDINCMGKNSWEFCFVPN